MIAIKNGKIVTPDRIIEGKTLWLDKDRIAAVGIFPEHRRRSLTHTAGIFCRE